MTAAQIRAALILLGMLVPVGCAEHSPAQGQAWPVEEIAPSPDVPQRFEPGAARHISTPPFSLPEDWRGRFHRALDQPYQAARRELLKDDRYVAIIIASLLSDEERIAKRSFQLLRDFCDLKALRSDHTGQNPIGLEFVNAAAYRGAEFDFWASEWWPQNHHRLGPELIAPLDKRSSK